MADPIIDAPESSPRDRAQKAHSLFLQRIGKVKAGDIAKLMEMTDGQLSEIKNKKVEDALLLLAHLGLKVVPVEMRCMPLDAFVFLTSMHKRVVEKAPALIWEDVE